MTVRDPVYEPWSYTPPDARNAFGPILSAFEVEQALAQCVKIWIRDYLAEVCRQRSLPPETIPPYRSIVESAEPEKFPEDQCPALLVASPGLATSGKPIRQSGDGYYAVTYRVECWSLVSAGGNRQAVKLARLYAAAVGTLLLQQALEPSTIELSGIDWVDERFRLFSSESDRTICGGAAILDVDVPGVRNWQMGPLTPFYPPTPADEEPQPMEWAEIHSADVQVIKEEEDAPSGD